MKLNLSEFDAHIDCWQVEKGMNKNCFKRSPDTVIFTLLWNQEPNFGSVSDDLAVI